MASWAKPEVRTPPDHKGPALVPPLDFDIRGLGPGWPRVEAPGGWVKKVERAREGKVWVGYSHVWETTPEGHSVRRKKEKTLGAATKPKHENYFSVLGVRMHEGRSFESMGTVELSSTPPVLISENYWQKRFGGDRAVIGKTIYLNGTAVTISGITPHNFAGRGMGAPAFWLPASAEPLVHGDGQWLRNRENQRYRLFGRLASGVSMTQAGAQMSSVAEHLRSLHDPRSEWAKPATVMVWPGSPFPLPLKE